ncbi:MAG: diaminopimelate epimerase [Planctomycetaceae bacterium]
MRFTKMQGAGNDYVYVDLFEESVEDAPSLARAMSDRHKGVGADGLILLKPARGADVAMEMYNADGSRAEICGNGIRCLAKLAFERGRSKRNPMRVDTDGGPRSVALLLENGRVTGARVDMGAPLLDPRRIPARFAGERAIDQELEAGGRRFRATCVSMGNPHAVIYVDDVASFEVARFGPLLERHAAFPNRTNVEFVQVLGRNRVRQRTWERGSGETQACGTGACAVCVAGILTGRTDSPLTSLLLGGELELAWDGDGAVLMTGPAVEVFSGDWPTRGV